MSSRSADSGMTVIRLWRLSWILGFLAGGSCVRLAHLASAGPRVQSEHLVWLAVAACSAVFSACCAVLVGLKSAEARLSRQDQRAAL